MYDAAENAFIFQLLFQFCQFYCRNNFIFRLSFIRFDVKSARAVSCCYCLLLLLLLLLCARFNKKKISSFVCLYWNWPFHFVYFRWRWNQTNSRIILFTFGTMATIQHMNELMKNKNLLLMSKHTLYFLLIFFFLHSDRWCSLSLAVCISSFFLCNSVTGHQKLFTDSTYVYDFTFAIPYFDDQFKLSINM